MPTRSSRALSLLLVASLVGQLAAIDFSPRPRPPADTALLTTQAFSVRAVSHDGFDATFRTWPEQRAAQRHALSLSLSRPQHQVLALAAGLGALYLIVQSGYIVSLVGAGATAGKILFSLLSLTGPVPDHPDFVLNSKSAQANELSRRLDVEALRALGELDVTGENAEIFEEAMDAADAADSTLNSDTKALLRQEIQAFLATLDDLDHAPKIAFVSPSDGKFFMVGGQPVAIHYSETGHTLYLSSPLIAELLTGSHVSPQQALEWFVLQALCALHETLWWPREPAGLRAELERLWEEEKTVRKEEEGDLEPEEAAVVRGLTQGVTGVDGTAPSWLTQPSPTLVRLNSPDHRQVVNQRWVFEMLTGRPPGPGEALTGDGSAAVLTALPQWEVSFAYNAYGKGRCAFGHWILYSYLFYQPSTGRYFELGPTEVTWLGPIFGWLQAEREKQNFEANAQWPYLRRDINYLRKPSVLSAMLSDGRLSKTQKEQLKYIARIALDSQPMRHVNLFAQSVMVDGERVPITVPDLMLLVTHAAQTTSLSVPKNPEHPGIGETTARRLHRWMAVAWRSGNPKVWAILADSYLELLLDLGVFHIKVSALGRAFHAAWKPFSPGPLKPEAIKRVVFLGAGPAIGLQALARLRHPLESMNVHLESIQAISVDFAPGMLAAGREAQQNQEALKGLTHEVLAADITAPHLPLGDGSSQLIETGIFENFEPAAKIRLLYEAHRILEDRGLILLSLNQHPPATLVPALTRFGFQSLPGSDLLYDDAALIRIAGDNPGRQARLRQILRAGSYVVAFKDPALPVASLETLLTEADLQTAFEFNDTPMAGRPVVYRSVPSPSVSIASAGYEDLLANDVRSMFVRRSDVLREYRDFARYLACLNDSRVDISTRDGHRLDELNAQWEAPGDTLLPERLIRWAATRIHGPPSLRYESLPREDNGEHTTPFPAVHAGTGPSVPSSKPSLWDRWIARSRALPRSIPAPTVDGEITPSHEPAHSPAPAPAVEEKSDVAAVTEPHVPPVEAAAPDAWPPDLRAIRDLLDATPGFVLAADTWQEIQGHLRNLGCPITAALENAAQRAIQQDGLTPNQQIQRTSTFFESLNRESLSTQNFALGSVSGPSNLVRLSAPIEPWRAEGLQDVAIRTVEEIENSQDLDPFYIPGLLYAFARPDSPHREATRMIQDATSTTEQERRGWLHYGLYRTGAIDSWTPEMVTPFLERSAGDLQRAYGVVYQLTQAAAKTDAIVPAQAFAEKYVRRASLVHHLISDAQQEGFVEWVPRVYAVLQVLATEHGTAELARILGDAFAPGTTRGRSSLSKMILTLMVEEYRANQPPGSPRGDLATVSLWLRDEMGPHDLAQLVGQVIARNFMIRLEFDAPAKRMRIRETTTQETRRAHEQWKSKVAGAARDIHAKIPNGRIPKNRIQEVLIDLLQDPFGTERVDETFVSLGTSRKKVIPFLESNGLVTSGGRSFYPPFPMAMGSLNVRPNPPVVIPAPAAAPVVTPPPEPKPTVTPSVPAVVSEQPVESSAWPAELGVIRDLLQTAAKRQGLLPTEWKTIRAALSTLGLPVSDRLHAAAVRAHVPGRRGKDLKANPLYEVVTLLNTECLSQRHLAIAIVIAEEWALDVNAPLAMVRFGPVMETWTGKGIEPLVYAQIAQVEEGFNRGSLQIPGVVDGVEGERTREQVELFLKFSRDSTTPGGGSDLSTRAWYESRQWAKYGFNPSESGANMSVSQLTALMERQLVDDQVVSGLIGNMARDAAQEAGTTPALAFARRYFRPNESFSTRINQSSNSENAALTYLRSFCDINVLSSRLAIAYLTIQFCALFATIGDRSPRPRDGRILFYLGLLAVELHYPDPKSDEDLINFSQHLRETFTPIELVQLLRRAINRNSLIRVSLDHQNHRIQIRSTDEERSGWPVELVAIRDRLNEASARNNLEQDDWQAIQKQLVRLGSPVPARLRDAAVLAFQRGRKISGRVQYARYWDFVRVLNVQALFPDGWALVEDVADLKSGLARLYLAQLSPLTQRWATDLSANVALHELERVENERETATYMIPVGGIFQNHTTISKSVDSLLALTADSALSSPRTPENLAFWSEIRAWLEIASPSSGTEGDHRSQTLRAIASSYWTRWRATFMMVHQLGRDASEGRNPFSGDAFIDRYVRRGGLFDQMVRNHNSKNEKPPSVEITFVSLQMLASSAQHAAWAMAGLMEEIIGKDSDRRRSLAILGLLELELGPPVTSEEPLPERILAVSRKLRGMDPETLSALINRTINANFTVTLEFDDTAHGIKAIDLSEKAKKGRIESLKRLSDQFMREASGSEAQQQRNYIRRITAVMEEFMSQPKAELDFKELAARLGMRDNLGLEVLRLMYDAVQRLDRPLISVSKTPGGQHSASYLDLLDENDLRVLEAMRQATSKRLKLDFVWNVLPGVIAGLWLSSRLLAGPMDLPSMLVGIFVGGLLNYFVHEYGHVQAALARDIPYEVQSLWGIPYQVIVPEGMEHWVAFRGPLRGGILGIVIGGLGFWTGNSVWLVTGTTILMSNLYALLPIRENDGRHLWSHFLRTQA